MATYEYEAVDHSGKYIFSKLVAEDQKDALRILMGRGLTPIHFKSIDTQKRIKPYNLSRSKPKTKDFILTIKQLSLLIKSGVPLISAVDTLKSQALHPHIVKAFENISDLLRSGTPFSDAIIKSFPNLPSYVFQLSKAGESIGQLGESLADAAKQMEYEYQVKQDIKTALTYPLILVASGLIAIFFIFLVVVPRFAGMLDSSSESLPFLSKLVFSVGMFVHNHFSVILVSFVLMAITFTFILRRTDLKDKITQNIFNLPLVGLWLQEAEIAKWSSMMSTMLKHGVELIKGLELARETIHIKTMQTKLEQATKLVRNGRSLSDSIKEQNIFSDTALSLIRVGEEAGELSTMLTSLANLYDESGKQRMKRFLLFLEPISIILIGILIGGIVTAIMLAITSINQVNI